MIVNAIVSHISVSDLLGAEGCNFGPGCRFLCNCENGTDCDPITGECTTGYTCSEARPDRSYGWGGPGCLTGLLGRDRIQERIRIQENISLMQEISCKNINVTSNGFD